MHPDFLPPGSPLTVLKLRPDGSLSYQWQGTVVHCDEQGLVLRATFNVDLVEREYATFRRGDEFLEFYYWDRWYNVFQVSTPDGVLKGWYGNVGQPAELRADRNELRYVDLELDIWATPDGQFVVLDEPEFATLLEAHPELRDAACAGRDALLARAATNDLPRWGPPSAGAG
jgi:protein associated with RNAse G/E